MKKVEIPIENLIELYVNRRLTMSEIAKIYTVDRTTISNRLKEFQISSMPFQRKHEWVKSKSLTQYQKDFLVGTLLGDGSVLLGGRRKNAYFQVSHCDKQKKYLEFKKTIMGDLATNVHCNVDPRGNSIMYQFRTYSHNEFNFYRTLFYNNNVKIISPEIKDHLTLFGLAIWYMDDGSRGKSGCRFSTEGFTEQENKLLRDIIKDKFNFVGNVYSYERNNNKYYYLYFGKENSIKMHQEIKKYVIDSMFYKLLIDRSSTTKCQNSEITKISECVIV